MQINQRVSYTPNDQSVDKLSHVRSKIIENPLALAIFQFRRRRVTSIPILFKQVKVQLYLKSVCTEFAQHTRKKPMLGRQRAPSCRDLLVLPRDHNDPRPSAGQFAACYRSRDWWKALPTWRACSQSATMHSAQTARWGKHRDSFRLRNVPTWSIKLNAKQNFKK